MAPHSARVVLAKDSFARTGSGIRASRVAFRPAEVACGLLPSLPAGFPGAGTADRRRQRSQRAEERSRPSFPGPRFRHAALGPSPVRPSHVFPTSASSASPTTRLQGAAATPAGSSARPPRPSLGVPSPSRLRATGPPRARRAVTWPRPAPVTWPRPAPPPRRRAPTCPGTLSPGEGSLRGRAGRGRRRVSALRARLGAPPPPPPPPSRARREPPPARPPGPR